MRTQCRAFTLIELLVVVAVIVTLLALLAPALERAIYQAELTVCAANLKTVGTGAISYAMGSKRYFPHRPAMFDPDIGNYFMRNLTLPFGYHNRNNVNGYDDRTTMREAIPMKSLQCPLGGPVDLAVSPVTTYVYASYAMWFGAQYRAAGLGGRGMLKLGDKITFNNKSYATLAGDNFNDLFGFLESPHPDDLSALPQFTRQDQPEANDLILTSSGGNITISEWKAFLFDHPAGEVDLNYTATDGSVVRYSDVRWLDVSSDAQSGLSRVPQMPHAVVEFANWLAIPSAP